MQMKITLPTDTRYFRRYGGWSLCQTGRFLGKGAEVAVGPLVRMYYNHGQQQATAFKLGENEYFFLVQELRIAGLVEKLDRLAKFEVVK